MSFRKFIRSLIFSSLCLYITTTVIPGFQISPGVGNLVIVTLTLTLLNFIVRPIVKLLLLPINLITLGAFRWLATIIILYLLTWVTPQVKIDGFSLSQIPLLGTILPNRHIGKFFATLLTTLSLTTIRRLLFWLTKG